MEIWSKSEYLSQGFKKRKPRNLALGVGSQYGLDGAFESKGSL